MAKLSETVRNFLGFNTLAEDYEEDYEESSSEGMYEENNLNNPTDNRFQNTASENKSRISGYEEDDSPINRTQSRTASLFESSMRTEKGTRQERMLGMNPSDNALSVVLSKPTEYKDCTSICSKLRERTTVVVNFEHLKNKEDKKRILDFIYGCCYAIDGNAQRISEHVYILAPYNVDIYDDLKEEAVDSDNEVFF